MIKPLSPSACRFLPAGDYDLAMTLNCGQAFRWRQGADGRWEGVVAGRWVQLSKVGKCIEAKTATPQRNWDWLDGYLQTGVDLDSILRTFPKDSPMQQAVKACRGLRLLRQEPWECLASFILSATKQIVQIQQIIECICARWGQKVEVPPGHKPAYSFPTPEVLAGCTEADLRECKMGFRAKHLHKTALMVVNGQLDLAGVNRVPLEEARALLQTAPGVGPKIADCVLLFAYGFAQAFPVDVWVQRALCELYFQGRKIPKSKLRLFAFEHFGPNAGYAQQYLFHYMRMAKKRLGEIDVRSQNVARQRVKTGN